MLSNKALIAALEYVRLLCQVPQPAQTSYVAALYTELKDIFTDDSLMMAAREICRNEKLYGVYPALAIWRQYSPNIRSEKLLESKKTGDFINDMDYVMKADPIIFDLEATRKSIWHKYGKRAAIAIQEFGGIKGIRSQGYGASQLEQERLRQRLKDNWNCAKLDTYFGVLQISNDAIKKIENNS